MAILSILLVLIIVIALGVYSSLQRNIWACDKEQDIQQAVSLLDNKFPALLYTVVIAFLLLGTVIFLDMLNIENQWVSLVFYLIALLLSMFTLYNAHLIFSQITKFRVASKQNKNPV